LFGQGLTTRQCVHKCEGTQFAIGQGHIKGCHEVRIWRHQTHMRLVLVEESSNAHIWTLEVEIELATIVTLYALLWGETNSLPDAPL